MKKQKKTKLELRASWYAIIIIIIQLFILGLAYGFTYNSSYNKDDKEVHTIDIITIVGTIMILFISICYWRVFYYGHLFGKTFKEFVVKSHTTEAYPMYTAMYAFGVGLLMPIISYIIKNETYQKEMYPFYPIVFLCIMFGYYAYEILKLGHYIY